ncbi:putative MFS-type transporter YcaD [Campylobacter suis]|uniref:MFS-type transporter YcaD n=2 Tax=Campylobacter suis TaxID=2790657 RepID=A0ABM8Q1B2_9BACT|nr:MFS transporter [Campylobacter suis]CAD7286591.1 putative MFS-type transporter YcaD [Campylobacter suis]
MGNSKRTIKTMGSLFFSISLMFIGNGLVVSSCSTLLKQMDVGEIEIGLINACFFVGAIISTIYSNNIISKSGHIRAFGIFTALFGVSAMLHNLSSNLYFWAILRTMLGFCYYGLLVITESWLNERAKNANRSRILAFYECVFYISFAMGILILALNLKVDEIFIVSAAFIMLSSIPLNIIRINPPKIPPKQKVSIPKIFSIVPLALAGSVVAGILINGFFGMAGLFILLQDFTPKEVSFFMTSAMCGGFMSQFFLGSISDKIGRRPAIMIACSVSLVASILFLFAGRNINFLYLLSFFLGSGVFCLYALSLARANDVLEERSTEAVNVGRALLFSYSFGSLVSSIIMGVVIKFLGSDGFIYVYIVLLIALLAFAATQRTIPVEHRTTYEPHVMRTPAIVKEGLEDGDS